MFDSRKNYLGLLALLLMALIHFHQQESHSDIPSPVSKFGQRNSPPRQSICSTLPEFSTVDTSPVRSPLLVADHLINLAAGGIVFEVGTRNGDILSCVSRFTNATFSAEIDPEYCRRLRERGLSVYCGDFLAFNMSSLPQKPDVFFWWPMVAEEQNEVWLSHVRSQESYISPGYVVIIGFDHQWPPDMENRKVMLTRYPEAEEHVIDFDEGEDPRMKGKFSLIHFHPQESHGVIPSPVSNLGQR